jgi:hypothetical protein
MMRLMYPATLLIHSWLRWAVLVAGVAAVSSSGAASAARGSKAGMWFTILLDVQFLVGLSLYLFISPNTTAAMHHFGESMHVAATRFFLVEHPFGMIAAVVIAHLGRVRAERRRRPARGFYLVALLILLVSLPWPGLPYGRPFFRF